MSERDPSRPGAPSIPCEQCGGSVALGDDVLRCECGSLLARFVAGRVELKCRRCKRFVLLPPARPRE